MLKRTIAALGRVRVNREFILIICFGNDPIFVHQILVANKYHQQNVFIKIDFDWLTLKLPNESQKLRFSCAFFSSFVQLELDGMVEISCEPGLICSTMVDNAFPQ